MSTRVSLVDRLEKDQHELDPQIEASFVSHGNVVAHARDESLDEMERQPTTPGIETKPKSSRRPKQSAAITPGLIPVNVRVRPALAGALKTASLDRQMRGIEPHSKREIVEQALEPWLRSQGYLAD